jgi:hypothetical protein
VSRSGFGSLSTHDLVLSLIPGPLLVAVAVAVFSGVDLAVALAAGSLLASVAIGYALFYDPPVETETSLLPVE